MCVCASERGRGMARGRNPGQRGQPCPRAGHLDIKRGVFACGTQFAASGTSPYAFLLCSVLFLWPAAFTSGTNGVQLRGQSGGGGQVPWPRPRAQHDAHRRGGVAQDDAEELVVRVVRAQPRSRSPQVRLCAAYSCRVLQVPSPPHQLPRPRPPVVPSVTGHRRDLVAVVLWHRRGVVTRLEHRSVGIKKRKPNRKRSGGKIRGTESINMCHKRGSLFVPPLMLMSSKKIMRFLSFLSPCPFVGIDFISLECPPLHQRKFPCFY